MTIQFIPSHWLELTLWNKGMIVYSYKVKIPKQYGPQDKSQDKSEIEQMIREVLGI